MREGHRVVAGEVEEARQVLTEGARQALRAALPVTDELQPFRELVDRDVCACPPEAARSYAALGHEEARRVRIPMVRFDFDLARFRRLLLEASLPRGKAFFHVGECQECGTRVVRVGVLVSIDAGDAGDSLEVCREYGVPPCEAQSA